MAQWIEANREFHAAVREQVAALADAHGIEGAYKEAQRLRHVAPDPEARLFAYNVELLAAEAAGFSPEHPEAPAWGPEAPVWLLPFVSERMVLALRDAFEKFVRYLRIPAAPSIGLVVQGYRERRRDRPTTLGLTPRQLECLRWAAEGKSSTDIAAILGISAHTVDEHLDNTCRRCGVRRRSQAIAKAVKAGIIDPPPN